MQGRGSAMAGAVKAFEAVLCGVPVLDGCSRLCYTASMDDVLFERMGEAHRAAVMQLFNIYVESGTAAFSDSALPMDAYDRFLEDAKSYPSFVLMDPLSGAAIGFCMLREWLSSPTFRRTACVTYFLAPAYLSRGLGTLCLNLLIREAEGMGIRHLIAEISAENEVSLHFHEKHGFRRVALLENIGFKLGREFGIVLMQRDIS